MPSKRKYGLVDGTVTHVSADATELPSYKPEHEHSPDTAHAPLSYKAIVTLNAQALEREGARFQLAPGMRIAAEINQGQRTILEYLLFPVQGVFHEASRER